MPLNLTPSHLNGDHSPGGQELKARTSSQRHPTAVARSGEEANCSLTAHIQCISCSAGFAIEAALNVDTLY
jgi:hypothetical protein